MNIADVGVAGDDGAARVTVEGAEQGFDLPRELLGMLEQQEGRRRSVARRPARGRAGAASDAAAATGRSRRTSSSRSAASTSSTSRSASQTLRARTKSGYVGKAGDRVWARIDPSQAHFFDTASGNSLAPALDHPAFSLQRLARSWPASSSRTSPRTSAATARSKNLDLDIADGEFFVLLGPTGAGKTTTLRLIAGLDKPTSGQVFIDGIDVADWGPAERDVALVLQQYSLYPRFTVRENLDFPLKSNIRRIPDAEIAKRVARVAKTLRIEHLLDRKTDRLSGGEMQRVSIGRAIVREPRVFLMDEPLSALDAKLREALRTELKDLQMRLGATFIFVTHDQIEAMTMGDKIGVLNHGRLVQVGTPYEIYNNPHDTFVASFVGSPPINLVEGKLVSGRAVMAPMNFELPYAGPAANADGRPLVFGIRPEDLYLESGAPVEAKVHDVENHGIEKILTLRVGDVMLRATVPARTNVAIEQPVRFAWNPEKVVLFDKGTGVSLRHAG